MKSTTCPQPSLCIMERSAGANWPDSQVLFSVHPQLVWGSNLLFVCRALMPPPNTAELLTPELDAVLTQATPVSSGIAVASPQEHLILGTRQNAECWGHGPSVEEADSHELLSAPICQATRILVSLSPNLANSLHLALGIRFLRALLCSPCLKDQKSKDGSPAHPSQALSLGRAPSWG